MSIEWPKGFGEWTLFLALFLGVVTMFIYERPSSFECLVVVLLLGIFSRMNRKEVTKHTFHINIKK